MVIFENAGEIDVRSVTAFGVSAKEPGSIGYFGTGLKYAIAILLRTGHKVTIHAGVKVLRFGTRKATIRGKVFEFVTLNNRRTEFTTEVGKNWQVWQAFRELYCNAMDEKGQCCEVDSVPAPKAGHTTVIVEGSEITEAFLEKDDIILSSKPIDKGVFVEVHPGPSRYVYYKGVRAYRLNAESLHTYNITKEMDLTEDRTFNNSWLMCHLIMCTLLWSGDNSVIGTVVTAKEGTWEKELCYSGDPSEAFKETVAEKAKTFSENLNPSAQQVCRTRLDDALAAAHVIELDETDKQRLSRAVAFCRGIGSPVDEYRIVAVDFLGHNMLGLAHKDTIYLTRDAFEQGTKILAGTLMEEFFHLRFQVKDETRTFQNLLINKLVSLGERITGEVL